MPGPDTAPVRPRRRHSLAMFPASTPATTGGEEAWVTQTDYAQKLDELDHLLNDPDAPMQPDRVWSLLAEISEYDLEPGAQRC